MAQDVRPYKSKEQDGQGNEIILRDQQLVEQTSQTTMASGEYFEIVDVDGRMAKIPKDNMIGVVREALGILLNGLADQTTVAKFLTLNGNTLGASAAATAASVLGASTLLSKTEDGHEPETIDANTIATTRIVKISSSSTNIPSIGYTHGSWFVNLVHGANYKVQFVFGRSGENYTRYKNGDTWGSWSRLYDESILTNSTLLSPLASALGAQLFIRVDEITVTATVTPLPYEEYKGIFLLSLRKQDDDRTYSTAIIFKAKSEVKVITLDTAAITNYININTQGSVILTFSSKDETTYVLKVSRFIP